MTACATVGPYSAKSAEILGGAFNTSFLMEKGTVGLAFVAAYFRPAVNKIEITADLRVHGR